MLNQPKNVVANPALCEPFQNGRQTGRLLHDLGAMITEAIAKMGLSVTAFDIHEDIEDCLNGRISADARIEPSLISTATGDGHDMPFADNSFGHLLCYDTLHHMHDYDQVFREFYRVLKPGGRAVFVEPGAKHSTSPDTIEFMKSKTHDPSWIERDDVVLEEIDAIARRSGLSRLTIAPMQHPSRLRTELDSQI